MTEGKVWLVGAGPGDTGLITVKGEQVLKEAQVVVYDHLVNPDLLARYGDGKRFINVGKQAGRHLIPQQEIQEILVREARAGNKVVRLKGGDPFLFGRGGEEAMVLAKEGIPFEVVPGVTSALAVPAYNGIPVTHRDCASSVHIITAHKRQGREEALDYPALAALEGTLVFLMGVAALPEITAGLLGAGMKPETPAAVLQEGTTADQRKVIGTLEDLAERAVSAGIRPPAVILVGQVCALTEELGWYEDLPLMGMRLLLARPRERMEPLAGRLRTLGAQVLEAPAVELVPVEEDEKIRDCISHLEAYDWLVFTSPAGVRIFFADMERRKADVRRLGHIRIAVIGEGTGKALEERGIYPDLMPQVYDGVSLGRALAGEDIRGKRILLPRAKRGNPELVPLLEEAGAAVDDISIYRTLYPESQTVDIRKELEEGRIDCVVLTSASTADGLARMAGQENLKGRKAACIGPETARRAREYGLDCRIAEEATIESLTALIERIKEDHDQETTEIEK